MSKSVHEKDAQRKCECGKELSKSSEGKDLWSCECGNVYGRFFAPNEIWMLISTRLSRLARGE